MTKSRDNATNVAGDISGVTASTGLSGGGSSGDLTLTNTMATAIDAKADLIVGTGADAFSRLGVGANDTILVAASGEATGLKWAAPAAASAVACSAFNSVGQAITAFTLTALALNTQNYDTNTFHNTSVNNSRMTIPATFGGKYRVSTTVSLTPAGDITLHLYKNGSPIALGTNAGQIARLQNVAVQLTFNANFDIELVATDFVQVFINVGATGITTVSQVISIAYLGA